MSASDETSAEMRLQVRTDGIRELCASEDDPNLDEPDASKLGNDAGRTNAGAGAPYGATSAEVLSPALRSLFEALAVIAPRAEIAPRTEIAPRASPPSASRRCSLREGS